MKDERETANLHRYKRNYPLFPELRDFNFADHLEPIVLIAMNTGLRKGELLSLRWENVDLVNNFLTITGSKAKSDKARFVPLNQTAKNTFAKWLADVQQHSAENDYSEKTISRNKVAKANGYVFEGENGNHLLDFKKAWGKLLDEASISNFRFHDLRHHFASKLVMAGVDLNTVRELLGHGSLDMTLRYAHLAPEHKAMAVSLIC
tara:strand:- start:197 stop:811 length:615 start_codon:yes stop_codon:yes gene_type:complete